MRNRFEYPQAYGNFSAGASSLGAAVGAFNDTTLTWDDIPWLRGVTKLPLVVKGILTAQDAQLAVDNGAAAIVVSNHGGRQLDRTPATIDVLQEVVDAVAGGAEVFLDGGVRRAVDVVIALAIGARGVFIGRPFIFALATVGESGVSRALAILSAELRTDMALLGAQSIGDLNRDFVRRV